MLVIQSQFWISSMTIVMLLAIFGSFAKAEDVVVDGKKLYGEGCKQYYGECDYEKSLVCTDDKCQCDASFAHSKKKPTPPTSEGDGTHEGEPNPEHIPAKLEWDADGKTCVIKKGSPCELNYNKDEAIKIADCKGKCKKGGKTGRDDLGVCSKDNKGKKAAGNNIQVSRILNLGLPSLLILLFAAK